MAKVRKISVVLSEDQSDDLQAAVDSGAYQSTHDILQEAIADWRMGHTLRGDDVECLRTLWDAGRDDGVTRPFDIERVLGTARKRSGKVAAE